MTEHNNPQDNITVRRELLRWAWKELAGAGIGYECRAALRAALEQPAPVQEPTLPDITSRVVNDMCWKIVEELPNQLSSTNFNALKPAVYEALKLFIAPQPQPAPVQEPVTCRVIECARRLVEHADFQLGGVLSADSKVKDIPSRAVSKVKSRHLASLRDALTHTTAQPRKAVKLSEREVANIFHEATGYHHSPLGDESAFARAIEAAVWAKLGVTE